MPCNCKTNRDLISLANIFGSKGMSKKSIFGVKVNNFFYSIFIIFFLIFATIPLLFYIIFVGLFSKDKGIHFDKIFNLKKNV